MNQNKLKIDKLKIGQVEIAHPFVLAPLAGITDVSMRRLCKEQGASLVYTEMVSAKGLYYNGKKTEDLLHTNESEAPVAFQIFGSEPDIMAYAAKELEPRSNVILDVNMGCPVPKVVKNGEGSALLKTPKLAADIIKTLVQNTSKAVTAKIRIGWDKDSINAVEVAKRLEDAGASAIAVHGRTREQYYSGEADWSEIIKVKDAVSIPVIGNGDIYTGADAVSKLNESGCDLVMIARGALGNPWIFKEAIEEYTATSHPHHGAEPPDTPGSKFKPTVDEKIDMLQRHFELIAADKGEHRAVLEIRKFAGWYLKGIKGAANFRGIINTITSKEDFFEKINSLR